jgi:hypothetical protein
MRTMLTRNLHTILFIVTAVMFQQVALSAEGTTTNSASSHMKIKIGSKTFDATLEDNPTVAAFKAMLPLTVDMQELNGNEKLHRLPNKLPTKASNPGTIKNGDLMLYGANTVVLFYKSFPTSYSYTRLGRINDPAGLASAVGSGSVKVTFELVGKP